MARSARRGRLLRREKARQLRTGASIEQGTAGRLECAGKRVYFLGTVLGWYRHSQAASGGTNGSQSQGCEGGMMDWVYRIRNRLKGLSATKVTFKKGGLGQGNRRSIAWSTGTGKSKNCRKNEGPCWKELDGMRMWKKGRSDRYGKKN